MSRSATSSTSRRTGGRRLVGVVSAAVLLLVAAGCSTPSNTPGSYGETNADGVDIVQANFLEGCVAAGKDADTENTSDCQCIYNRIVEEIPFDEFQDIESQLEDDPTDLPNRYIDIVDGCTSGEITAPAADDTTTTTD